MDWQNLPKREHFKLYPHVDVKNSKGWFEVLDLPKDVVAIAEPRHEQNGCFYLVKGSEGALLFDTGLGIADPSPLIHELYDGEVTVVNSHFHFDHMGGNHFFSKCFCHLDSLVESVAKNGLGGSLISQQVRPEAFLCDVPSFFDPSDYMTQPFNYAPLSEGMVFNLGNRALEVIFSPGHSPDGVVLRDEENNIMLMGDTFYLGALYGQFACPEFGYSNLEDYSLTLHKLEKTVRSDTLLFCSHNACIAPGEKLGQAAYLMDKILENRKNYGDADFDDSEKIIEGDGFSIVYR